MRMTRRTGLGVALAAALLSGCAGQQQGGAMPASSEDGTRPPLSSTRLPTRPPAKPPKTPTDLVPTDLVIGRVTRGGSGPCYGVVDDDAVEYAVFSTAGVTLAEGATVRIRFDALKRAIDCGAGRRIHASKIDVLS
jgi:hypothetical protein